MYFEINFYIKIPYHGDVECGADTLSNGCQVLGPEWALAQDVDLVQYCWPLMINLFATLNYCLLNVFTPVGNPLSLGADNILQSRDCLQVYAFPPFVMICQVLNKLCLSKEIQMTNHSILEIESGFLTFWSLW